MKKILYKKIFILLMCLLFIIFYSSFSMDIVDSQEMISSIGLYCMGVHYCYGSIFKTKIYFPGGSHDMGNVSVGIGIFILLFGACFILLSLLSLSGYIDIQDLVGFKE